MSPDRRDAEPANRRRALSPRLRAKRPVHGELLHTVLMLTLTFSTGIIDAVGFLGLDRVFTGNMTGNVVILGMGIAGADDLPVLGPIVALGGFIAGAVLSGASLRSSAPGWSRRPTILLAVVAVVLLLAAVAAQMPIDADLSRVAATTLLGAAMGIQAGVARHIAVVDVTTVVITSTLVALAYESRLGARRSQRWLRRTIAVAALAVGALTGAMALRWGLAWGIGAAAVITAAVSVVGAISHPDPDRAPTS